MKGSRFFIFLLLHSLFSFLVAQSSRLNELKKQLASAHEDTAIAWIADEMVWEYIYIDIYAAERLARRNLIFSGKIADKRFLAMACHSLATVFLQQNKEDSALWYFQQAVKYYKQAGALYKLYAPYNGIGNIYSHQGVYEEALRYYLLALKYMEQYHPAAYAGVIKGNIGVVYFNMNQRAKAISYYEEALKDAQEANDTSGIYAAYLNLANVYYEEMQYEKAEKCYKKAYKLIEMRGDKYSMANVLLGMGNIYCRRKEYPTALVYHLKALQYYDDLGNVDGMVTGYYNIAGMYYTMNKKDQAYRYLMKCIEYAQQIRSYRHLADAYHFLHEYFNEKHRYKESVNALEQHIAYKDSAMSEQSRADIDRMEVLYKTAQKEQMLKSKELLLQKKQADLKAKTIQRNAVLIFSCFLLLFLILVIKAYRDKKKANKIIQDQKKLVEEKNKDIMDSITYARRIQQAILPSPTRWRALLPHSFVLYLPKDIVAGDFYWLEESGEYIYVAAADCTGHGVPGAMVSVVCSSALTKAVLEEKLNETDQILNRVREIVIEKLTSEENIRDGMDVCLIRLTKGTNTLQYSGANRPLYVVEGNELKEFKPDKQPIGRYEEMKPFSKQEIVLQKNSMLYLCTDGYADQFGGEKGKKIGSKSFRALLTQEAALPDMEEQQALLQQYFQEWKGGETQVDDVTVLGLRVL